VANDPYGFPEAAPSGGAPADDELSKVLWMGVGSAICAAVGPCLCYLPYLAGVPLGVLAAMRARRFRDRGSALERTAANVAMASGITGAALGVLVVLTILAYMLFLAVAAVAGGELFSDM
jgi:hypothetical protein